jgi:uncharacterized cupin superfamily protein
MGSGVRNTRFTHMNVATAEFGDQEAWGAISLVYRARDLRRAAGVWRFGPGSFAYEANHGELLYMVEGEVEVSSQGGEVVLRAGDLAYIPEHLTLQWEAEAPVVAVFCSVADDEPLDY